MAEWIWTYALGVYLSQPRTDAQHRQSRVRRRMGFDLTRSRKDTR
jgi:hypothetical protein